MGKAIFNREIEIVKPDLQLRYDIIDTHLHFLDFTQTSDGFPSLVQAMDASGVSRAVVFGMPMMKKWDDTMKYPPAYYLSNDSRCYYYSGTDHIVAHELLSQPKEIRDRFIPFCCGFDCTDRYAADQIERTFEMYPDFWCGIGEIMSRHDDLTALTYGEAAHINNKGFRRIFDLAARMDVPVLVHHNISAQNTKEPLYLEELQQALAYNRNARIIWAHVGISRRIMMDELLIIAGQLLHDNPNLWVDISWLVFDDYIRGDKMIGTSDPEIYYDMWAALIEHYPDRFLIGSDKVGHWATYPEEILKYYSLIDRLKPDTAAKLCRENILTLLKKKA